MMKSDEQKLMETYQNIVCERSERFEPDYDNDIFIEYNNRHGLYDISMSEKHLKGGLEWDDAIEFILDWMEKNNWYPNVWDIDDHGGLRLVNLDEESRVDEGEVKSYKHKWLPIVIDTVAKDQYILTDKTYPKTSKVYDTNSLNIILKNKYNTTFDHFVETSGKKHIKNMGDNIYSYTNESSLISSIIKSDNGLSTASKNSKSVEQLQENMTKLVKYFKLDKSVDWNKINWKSVYESLNENNRIGWIYPIQNDGKMKKFKVEILPNRYVKVLPDGEPTPIEDFGDYYYSDVEISTEEAWNKFMNTDDLNEAEKLEGYPKYAYSSEKARTRIYRTLLHAIKNNIKDDEQISFGDIAKCLTTPEETHPNTMHYIHNDNVMWVFNKEKNPKITIAMRSFDFAREVENQMMSIDDSLMFKMVNPAIGYLYKE